MAENYDIRDESSDGDGPLFEGETVSPLDADQTSESVLNEAQLAAMEEAMAELGNDLPKDPAIELDELERSKLSTDLEDDIVVTPANPSDEQIAAREEALDAEFGGSTISEDQIEALEGAIAESGKDGPKDPVIPEDELEAYKLGEIDELPVEVIGELTPIDGTGDAVLANAQAAVMGEGLQVETPALEQSDVSFAQPS